MTNQRLENATREAFPNYPAPTKKPKEPCSGTPRPGSGRQKVIDREQVRTRTLNGQSLEQIANELGFSMRGIANVRAELGLTGNRTSRLTPERKARIEKMLDDGWSFAEITRTEGSDFNTLKRHFPGRQWTWEQRLEYLRTLRQLGVTHRGRYKQGAHR